MTGSPSGRWSGRRLVCCQTVALLFLFAVPALGAGISDLEIGDPARRHLRVEVAVDTITDTRSGSSISLPELVAALAEVDLLFLGENHTSTEFHHVQRLLIRELHRAGRKVLVGLEMYPQSEQKYLDQWVDGLLTEEGFVELSDWYENWGYHWRYYREIFLFAQEQRIPMFAVNIDPKLVSSVRMKGLDGLSEEESSQLPPTVDTDSEEHRRLFRAFFSNDEDDEEEDGEEEKDKKDAPNEEDKAANDDDATEEESSGGFHTSLTEEQWNHLFGAQCTWDAGMAYNSTQVLKDYLESAEGNGAPGRPIMVVLVGLGHVAYGLGAQRQAAHYFDGKAASIIPVTIPRDKNGSGKTQASYADFLWGVPEEAHPAYPSLGLASRQLEDEAALAVLFVQENSPAQQAGVKTGDVLLTLDGTATKDRGTLNWLVAGKSWGESATLGLRRDDEVVSVQVLFRRMDAE